MPVMCFGVLKIIRGASPAGVGGVGAWPAALLSPPQPPQLPGLSPLLVGQHGGKVSFLG